MNNPNLHTEKSQLTAAEKEFENTIRPGISVILPGNRRSLKTSKYL